MYILLGCTTKVYQKCYQNRVITKDIYRMFYTTDLFFNIQTMGEYEI